MAKQGRYSSAQRAEKAAVELPIQVKSLEPILQLWALNGHNKGLIDEFKSSEQFRNMNREIKSLQHWFKQPIGIKQLTTSDIIDSVFKLARLPSDSAISYNVFLCCNILSSKFDINLEVKSNGTQAYAKLLLGDSLEISALIWSALGCQVVAEYVNTNLRQYYIDDLSNKMERKIASLKSKGTPGLSIKDNAEILEMKAKISQLNYIESLPQVGSQIDPVERQKVLEACTLIDAQYIKGLVNTLNKCHPDAIYSIGTQRPELLLEALKQCNNNEASSRLRQVLFNKYGMPKIEDALRVIKAQEIYLNTQKLDAALTEESLSKLRQFSEADQLFISKAKEVIKSPDLFAAEQGKVIMQNAETVISKKICIIKDVLTLFSPEGDFLRSTDPQIIREIKDLISQEKCDCAPLNEILTFITPNDDTTSSLASSAISESLVSDIPELPHPKSEALFDVPDLT